MDPASRPSPAPAESAPATSPLRLDPAGAIAALAGTLLVLGSARLPAPGLLVLAGCVLLLLGRRSPGRLLAWVGLACLSGAIAAWHAQRAQSAMMVPELHGQQVWVQGSVVGLPHNGPRATRFEFRVDSAEADGVPPRLLLRWFGPPEPLRSGERYALRVQLEMPWGRYNPGGFDAERWAVERGLGGRGQVCEARRLGDGRPGIDGLREALAATLDQRLGPGPVAAALRAMSVGDQRGLDAAQREILLRTGTGHLMAISGLHVGLAAAGAGLLAAAAWMLWPALGLRLARPQAMALAGLIAATGYAALAGFALPTRRALLMLAVLVLALALRRALPFGQGLALALLAILVVDPLAVLGASFWMSYAAVALLLLLARRGGPRSGLVGLGRAQLWLTLGLAPLALFWFGASSLVGLLANLLAVPWVSLLVVPPLLLGMALELLLEGAGRWPMQFAAAAFTPLWSLLQVLAGLPLAALERPGLPLWVSALAALAIALLWLPRGAPGRWLALPLLLPLLWPATTKPPYGQLRVVLLDVGQGQALLLQTRGRALLYDTGPASGPETAQTDRILVPALRALGVRRLDLLVLSHADREHDGALQQVRAALAPERVLSGAPARHAPAEHCLAGQRWQWDGVAFELLHPPRYQPYAGDDSSCVLRVQAGEHALLVAGDAGPAVEQRLLRAHGPALRSTVLVSSQHGHRRANGEDWLQTVAPLWLLHSVGPGQPRGLPHAETLERAARLGIRQASTAESGALWLELGDAARQLAPRGWRDHKPRWWQLPRPRLAPTTEPAANSQGAPGVSSSAGRPQPLCGPEQEATPCSTS